MCKIKTLSANTAKLIANDKLNITEKIKGTAKFKVKVPSTKPFILNIQENNFPSTSPYIATISKTSQTMANFQDIFTNTNDYLNVTILQNNIKTAAAQRYHEVKWNCRPKTLAPHGLKTKTGNHAKEM